MLQEQRLNDMESDGYTQCRVLDGADDKVSEIQIKIRSDSFICHVLFYVKIPMV